MLHRVQGAMTSLHKLINETHIVRKCEVCPVVLNCISCNEPARVAGKLANAIFASEIEKIAVETNTTINTEDLNIFLQNISKACKCDICIGN